MTPAGSISWPTAASSARPIVEPCDRRRARVRHLHVRRVKSCMDDFTSGHGRTFEGDENWLVCPLELADSLASKGMLPKGAGRVLARRPRRPAEALRHFRIPAGARRPGNRADMGDAEAEELMRDRCRFSRIDHRHICPDAYPHIGIHTRAHTRTRIYTHQHHCTYARRHKT